MKRRIFVIGIIFAAVLAFTSIGFAMWGILSQQKGESSGNYTAYTIIDLDNITSEAPVFYYNNYGFYDNGSYSYETSFTFQITTPLKESVYDLSITLIDQDSFLSTATITSTSTRNSEVGNKTILIEDISTSSTFDVSYIISSDSTNYSSIFSNLSSKTISIRITAATDDGTWTIDKIIILDARPQSLIKITKPSADNTDFTYTGSEQTYSIPDNTGYIIANNKQTNANTYDVSVTLKPGYTWNDDSIDVLHFNFIIKKAMVLITNYTSLENALSITYTSPKSYDEFKTLITPQFNIANFTAYSIQCMFDGSFIYYDNVSDIASFTSFYKNDFKGVYSTVVGSTYRAYLKLSDTNNYEWDSSSSVRSIFIKYKTAKIGSTYYTIEDALSISGSGSITFPANLTTIEANVQITAFSLLLSTKNYANNNHELYVPHINEATTNAMRDGTLPIKDANSSAHQNAVSYNTGACLYIPNGISYSTSKNIYVTSSTAGNGIVGDHGVLFNDGLIYLTGENIMYSYGFVKGNGKIDLSSNSKAYDIMRFMDYPGSTTNLLSLKNNNIFPIYAWVLNNISCKTVYNNGAMLYAYVSLWGSSAGYNNTTALVVGKKTSSNGLFLPKSDSSANKIVKYGTGNNCNSLFASNNQGKDAYISNMTDVMANIEVFGKYNDSTVSASISVMSLKTDKDIPICISHANITIKEGAQLSLSKTSFIFGCGTQLVIEQNATVEIASGVKVAFDQLNGSSMSIVNYIKANLYNVSSKQVSSKCINNGTISGDGTIGGLFDCEQVDAMITTTNKSITNLKVKNSVSGYTTFSGSLDATGRTTDSNSNNALTATGYISIKGTYTYWAELSSINSFYINYKEVDESSISIAAFYGTNSTYTFSNDNLILPIKLGYTFVGWYSDISLNDEYMFENLTDSEKTVGINETFVLYAKWEKTTYTIQYHIYDSDLETIFSGSYLNDNPSSFVLDSVFDLNDASTNGLYFSGWFIDTGFTYGAVYSFNNTSFDSLYGSLIDGENTLHLYGYFSDVQVLKNFTITYFKLNDSYTGNPSSASTSDYIIDATLLSTITEGDSITLNNGYEAIDISPTTYYLSQYEFKQWRIYDTSLALLATVNANETYTPNQSILIRPVYERKDYYSISLSLSGAKVTVNGTQYSSSTTMSVLSGSSVTWSVSYDNSNDQTCTIQMGSQTINSSPFTISANTTITASSTSCLLPDTLVLMADGTYREVQYIVPGDELLVFNHETGKIETSFVTFNDYEEESLFRVINLHFTNGHSIGVVYEHGFFDLDLMTYVYITESNYQDYIGHRFYGIDGEYILDDACISEETVKVYSPITCNTFNYFTEGLLSMPGGIEGLFNYFDYDDSLKYDEDDYNWCIENIGLFTFEDLEFFGVSRETFDAYNAKYFKIAMAKGLLTEDMVYYYVNRYGHYFE